MRLDQGEDGGELRGIRQPQEHLESLDLDTVSRNAHGQSLDEARTEFRAEWEARIQEKRRQAAQARQSEEQSCDDAWKILGIGTVAGVGVGLLLATVVQNFVTGLAIGFSLGTVITVPLVLLLTGAAWCSRRHAERLEREVRELERS